MNETRLEMFSSLDTPWAVLAVCSEVRLDGWADQLATTPGLIVRIIRGKHCTTAPALMQEWSAALQFPYYFGHNWDAMNECLADLEWLPGKYYVFCLTHIEKVLPRQEKEFANYISVLNYAVREWKSSSENPSRPPVPFHVVFHCEPEQETAMKARLTQVLESEITILHLAS